MTCAEAETFVQAYVDGELTGRDRQVYEHHIGDCGQCRSASRFEGRFKAAVRAHLGRKPVPAELEGRLRRALVDQPIAPRRWPWTSYPRLVPVLAAAGVLLAITGTLRTRPSFVHEQARRTFQAELPFDVAGPDCGSIASWFRGRVDFPVHPPRLPGSVTCEGGRLVNVEDRPAAYLVYHDQSGRRLSVLVFDPAAAPIEAPQRRVVNGREIFYRGGPGVSTAAYRDRGLGYVVTSDLDEESLTQLVSATLR